MRKWILAQKNIKESCCVECADFSSCLEINRINRWKIIHGENFISSSFGEKKD
jgi:hypothetical protein